jgi:hypothetical protein
MAMARSQLFLRGRQLSDKRKIRSLWTHLVAKNEIIFVIFFSFCKLIIIKCEYIFCEYFRRADALSAACCSFR